MRTLSGFLIILFIFITEILFAASPNIYIEQQSDDHLTVIYKNSATTQFQLDELPSTQNVIIAVPPQAHPTFHILSQKTRIVRKNSNESVKQELITLSEPFIFRHSTLAALTIQPVQIRREDLLVYDSLKIQINFHAKANSQHTTPSDNDNLVLSKICLNADQAQKWQKPATQSLLKKQSWLGAALWYKINVDSSGFYIIDKNAFSKAGMNDASIQPEHIQVYNRGRQIALYVHAPNGSIDDEFYAVFYAKATDNAFTRRNVYWLTIGQSNGTRMAQVDSSDHSTLVVKTFRETVRMEEQKIYAEKSTLSERWYWTILDSSKTEKQISVNLPRLYTSTMNTHQLKIQLAGCYNDSLISHQCQILLNDSLVSDAVWQGNNVFNAEYSLIPDQLNVDENTITIRKPTGSSMDKIYLDWIELAFDSKLTLQDEALYFHAFQSGLQTYQVSGFQPDSTLVFNIANVEKPQNILFKADSTQLSFEDASTINSHYAVIHKQTLLPVTLEQEAASQLLLPTNRADYLIITPDIFKDAFTFFQKHKKSFGLQTKVITLSEIYNDFNDGIPASKAIQDFLDYAFDNWQKPAPYYCLLVGDATLDTRDYLGQGVDAYHMPTMIVNSPNGLKRVGNDQKFGCIAGSDNIPDYLIGRLPAHSQEELAAMLQKVMTYELQESESWQKNILYIADKPGDFDYETEANYYANTFLGAHFLPKKLFINNHAPEEIHQRFIDKFSEGALMSLFLGNGSTQNWGSDSLFSAAHVSQLQNEDKLPLLLSFNTENGSFYDPVVIQSLPEAMLAVDRVGAIASLMPSFHMPAEVEKSMLSQVQQTMLLNFINNTGTASLLNSMYFLNDADFRNYALGFSLLGDPSLYLKMSGKNIGKAAHFSGTVKVENSSLPDGSKLSAWVGNSKIDNEFTIQTDGKFGIFSIYEDFPGTWQREGCVLNDTIQFRVVRVPGDTANLYPLVEWKPGEHQYLDLFTYPTAVENAPEVTFTIDGKIAGIDYIMGDPVVYDALIECKVEFPTPTQDELYLYCNGRKCLENEYQLEQISQKTFSISYSTENLQDGTYSLNIHTSSGRVQNASLEFSIQSYLSIESLMNYPNPMNDWTNFSFILSNDKSATANLNIYTLAGRLIKKINQAAEVGFNQIFWDGIDDSGDVPANGVYLYKLMITDKDEQCSRLQKLIITK